MGGTVPRLSDDVILKCSITGVDTDTAKISWHKDNGPLIEKIQVCGGGGARTSVHVCTD
jgi:hypothetical protein